MFPLKSVRDIVKVESCNGSLYILYGMCLSTDKKLTDAHWNRLPPPNPLSLSACGSSQEVTARRDALQACPLKLWLRWESKATGLALTQYNSQCSLEVCGLCDLVWVEAFCLDGGRLGFPISSRSSIPPTRTPARPPIVFYAKPTYAFTARLWSLDRLRYFVLCMRRDTDPLFNSRLFKLYLEIWFVLASSTVSPRCKVTSVLARFAVVPYRVVCHALYAKTAVTLLWVEDL